MDKYALEGIIFIVIGMTIVIFHKKIGDFAIRFNEKVNEVNYDKSTRELSRATNLIMGIGLTIFGVLLFFHIIRLRGV